MWRQWSTPYRLGDDPILSAQHEYRFPTIIQLDEVAPPPPSSQKALLSPVPSSNQSYDYYTSSEECEEVEDGDGDQDEEEEEEATESYCSSDPSCPEFGMEDPERPSAGASAPLEQKVKMSRVLAWRNSFDSVFAEDHEGTSRPRHSHHTPWDFFSIPFLPLAVSPTSDDYGSVENSHVPGCHVPSPPRSVFSHAAFYLQRR